MPYPSRRYKPRVPVTRKRRAAYGAYRGRGLYTGRGSFFDSVKKRAGQAVAAYQKYIPQADRDLLRGAAMGVRDAGVKAARAYVGMGSYNDLVRGSRFVTPEPIVMRSSGDETSSVCISNKEYIGDLFGPNTEEFTNQSYALNPALNQVFPWLSQVAANYDEYEFEQLVFEYHPTISETSTATSGQSGTIILVTNYNPSQPSFTDKESMMQYHGGQSDRVTALSIHGVECDPLKSSQGRRYTRTQPVIVGQDAKNFDLGNFQVAINNIPDSYFNQQLGELWVHYKVHLHVPKLGSGRGNSINQDMFITANTSAPDSMFATTEMLHAQQNSIGCLISQTTIIVNDDVPEDGDTTFDNTFRITFPAGVTGDFEIQVRIQSSNFKQFELDGFVQGGNVALIEDQYPLLNESTAFNWESGGDLNLSSSFTSIQNVKVKSATGGSDNYLQFVLQYVQFQPPPEGTIWGQGFISVVERNPTFASSPSNPQPQWLTSTGVSQVPVPTQA